MTGKDYETIATCIKAEWNDMYLDRREGSKERAFYSLVNRIAIELELDNPQFDRAKFERACGF